MKMECCKKRKEKWFKNNSRRKWQKNTVCLNKWHNPSPNSENPI
jgi:hypothetical protein